MDVGDIYTTVMGKKYVCITGGTPPPSQPFNLNNVVDNKVVWGSLEFEPIAEDSGISTQLGICELLFACKDDSYDASSKGSRVVNVYQKSAKFDEYFSTSDNITFVSKKNCVVYLVAKVRNKQSSGAAPISNVFINGRSVLQVRATGAGLNSIGSSYVRRELGVGATVSFGYINADDGWHYGSWAILLNYDYEQDRQALTQELNDVKDI